MWKVIVVHIALVALVHAATVDYDKNIFKGSVRSKAVELVNNSGFALSMQISKSKR
jgi:hypothetical protein